MATRQKAARRALVNVRSLVMEDAGARLNTSNFYVQEDVFARGVRLPIPRQAVTAERPTVMAFADDAPLMNWAHPCRYLLHDAETGELYRQIPARFPPYANERETPRTFRPVQVTVTFPRAEVIERVVPDRILRPRYSGNRYAILFSGMSNNRHANDLEFLYRTLREVYGFPAANITVLNHDGTVNYDGGPKPVSKWPGDNSAYRMPLNGQGSKADLLAALNALKKKLKPDDFLLIHTNNHGGWDSGESNLCCYPNWDSLGVKAFTDKLAELPKYRCLMVMMEQCHSGGFNASVIAKSTADNTSIASACEEDKNSAGGAELDPFAHDWISAMTGSNMYGQALAYGPDINADGWISAREAFDYANANKVVYDTPVFDFKAGGRSCRLGTDLVWRIPPLPILVDLRPFWPEPDPLIIDRRVEAVLPQLEALEREIAPQVQALQERYRAAAERILKAAARG
jgi:hypothetical protein